MKRDPSLQGLSRDHHRALEVALRLRRADPETVADAVAHFREFWSGHGQRLNEHVRLEERTLFPLIEAALPADELAALGARLAEEER